MIIGALEPFPTGRIVRNVRLRYYGLRKDVPRLISQPFYVIREATFEEWLEYCKANFEEEPSREELGLAKRAWFYEISFD